MYAQGSITGGTITAKDIGAVQSLTGKISLTGIEATAGDIGSVKTTDILDAYIHASGVAGGAGGNIRRVEAGTLVGNVRAEAFSPSFSSALQTGSIWYVKAKTLTATYIKADYFIGEVHVKDGSVETRFTAQGGASFDPTSGAALNVQAMVLDMPANIAFAGAVFLQNSKTGNLSILYTNGSVLLQLSSNGQTQKWVVNNVPNELFFTITADWLGNSVKNATYVGLFSRGNADVTMM